MSLLGDLDTNDDDFDLAGTAEDADDVGAILSETATSEDEDIDV